MSVQSSRFTFSSLRKPFRLIVVGLGGLSMVGFAVGAGYGLRQWQGYRQQRAEWVQVQALEQSKQYGACFRQGAAIAEESRFYAVAQDLVQRCRLAEAQVLAQRQQLPEALTLLGQIPSSSDAHEQAIAFQQQWAGQLARRAEQQWVQGELQQAIATLQSLPETVAKDINVPKKIEGWRQTWANQEQLVKSATTLVGKGQWLAAQQTLTKVEHPYWKAKANPLKARAEQGIKEVLAYERAQAAARLAAVQAAARTPSAEPERAPSTYVPESSAAYAGSGYSAPALSAGGSEFQSRVEATSQDYIEQGQGSWDAWVQACESHGGRIIDRGPEAICQP